MKKKIESENKSKIKLSFEKKSIFLFNKLIIFCYTQFCNTNISIDVLVNISSAFSGFSQIGRSHLKMYL